MKATGHVSFITTPISSIIEETNRACRSLGSGIEIHPLASYIMQTTFLRMTGASEQKLKCICWEIGCMDYEFRYEMLQKPLGECSSFTDKNSIFSNVCKCLKRHYVSLGFSDVEKDRIIDAATNDFLKYLQSSPLSTIFEREYKEYQNYCSNKPIKRKLFCNPIKNSNISFIEEDLKKYYEEYTYRQRNRYAHNLSSYQLNVPTFTQLAKSENEKNNHFRMLSLLIIMDGIFITLFKKFMAIKSNHS